MRRRDIIYVATPATPYAARMAVVKQVAMRHGYDASDLIAPSTVPGSCARQLSQVRGEAALALRDQFQDSWPHIGRILGARDHSSIITAAARFKARAANKKP